MNERVIRRVHDVFGAGLELLERLERGESPRLEVEHGKLLSLVLAGGELDFDPVYNGELAAVVGRGGGLTGDLGSLFFGVRYALACWLDEIFLRDAPQWWRDQWVSDTLEVRLYGGANLRAERFWEQARKAEGPRGGPEALEVYLWCVMLGFRGDAERVRVDPARWVDNVRKRVLSGRGAEFPFPQQREAPSATPMLRGADRLVTMLRVALVFGGLATFALALTATKQFLH